MICLKYTYFHSHIKEELIMTYSKKDLKKLKKRIKRAEKRYDDLKKQSKNDEVVISTTDLLEMKSQIKAGKKLYRKEHKKYKKDMRKGGITCIGLIGVGAAAGIGIYKGCKKHHDHDDAATASFRI